MLHRSVAEGVHRVEDAYTNWYLVEADGAVTIVDTGHPRSWGSLQSALRELGRETGDVAAVVLTHAHFDHMGFAERARRELGVTVYAHERELDLTTHPLRYEHERSRLRYMLRHPGFDRAFAAMAAMGALFVKGLSEATPYRDGDVLDVPGRPHVVFTPGHTYGHASLHFPDRGVLIAGDAFVTYNPYTASHGPQIISGGATADSRQALSSLDRLAATNVDTVLTGHGAPWTGGVVSAVERARAAGPS